MSTDPQNLIDPDWWRQASVYQIYPRSFADGNGDGVGDLTGIISRVPYLKALGIDAVWLSPFYPSALADGGYDVDDYRDVDPKIGTLEQFDTLTEKLHAVGIRIIVDLVPNHSSNRHEWFQAALTSAPGSPERDRYIFRDGVGDEPPADWTSIFGGPSWTQVPDGQWYLHLFASEQPDLNWDNPEVRDDFLKTLRFWSDRGVDGFRVDVAHGLAKNLTEPLPSQAELDAITGDGAHPIWDRTEVHDIYRSWRTVLDDYDPPRIAIAEAWVAPHRRTLYAQPDSLGQAFNFDLLEADFSATQFRTIVTENLALAAESGSSSTWVFSNHDVVRHATRYGLPPRGDQTDVKQGMAWLLDGAPAATIDRDLGLRRARAATLFQLALPGSAYIYQGEELGLHEVSEITDAERQDPAFFRNPGVDIGRDGCRVPLPWTAAGSAFGFGDNGAHLPQPAWFGDASVEAQDGQTGSTLELYRRALNLRRDLQTSEELVWRDDLSTESVLAFERPGGWLVITNFGGEAVALPDGDLLLASGEGGSTLAPAQTAWLRM